MDHCVSGFTGFTGLYSGSQVLTKQIKQRDSSVQSVDVLLHGSPHPDLIDDVRRFFRGEAGGEEEDDGRSLSCSKSFIHSIFTHQPLLKARL